MNLFIKRKNYSTHSIISMAYFCMIFAALAHIIYSIVYFKTGYTFLGIHSICAIIMYCILIINFSEKRIRPIFIIINLELLSFVIFNSSIFDWRYSFQLYIFVIIPLIIISSSSHSTIRYNLKVAIIQFIVLCIAIFITKLYTVYYPNLSYQKLTEKHAQIYDVLSVFTFATALICAFLLLIAFTHDLNKTEEALLHASTHDPLTNLINRDGMKEKFQKALTEIQKSGNNYSIIIADLDNFKHINDTYGHNAGDDVLKSISQTFLNHVSPTDYVCRWGGEEILVLTANNIEHAKNLAETIRIAIKKNIVHTDETDINVTATFGIAQFSKDASLSETISKADKNLYIGKNSTKNCVII